MINEKQKNQYKSIKAPEELKGRILADALYTVPAKKSYAGKYLSIVAACMVAMLCIGFVGAGVSSSKVYVDSELFWGEKISVSTPYAVMSRARHQSPQAVELESFTQTSISIDNGEFTLLSSETGEKIYTGNKYSFKGKIKLQVDLPEGEKAVLTVQNKLSKREIIFEAVES